MALFFPGNIKSVFWFYWPCLSQIRSLVHRESQKRWQYSMNYIWRWKAWNFCVSVRPQINVCTFEEVWQWRGRLKLLVRLLTLSSSHLPSSSSSSSLLLILPSSFSSLTLSDCVARQKTVASSTRWSLESWGGSGRWFNQQWIAATWGVWLR